MAWSLQEYPDYHNVLQIPYPEEESIVKDVFTWDDGRRGVMTAPAQGSRRLDMEINPFDRAYDYYIGVGLGAGQEVYTRMAVSAQWLAE